MVAMGFAGVAAATVMGAALLGGDPNPDRASESRQDGSSYQSESTASGEMQQYLDQIRALDNEKQKLLNDFAFYQGNATIQETYKAPLGSQGDTPLDGSVAMVSEDIVAFDQKAGKGYLVARRIALLGDSMLTFEAARGTTETAMVKVTGILTEYYGNGVLKAYDVADALQGNKGYYLDFSANPVRFDRPTETIYTNPPVKDTYWVQVIGQDGVDLIATGVFTPEELPSVDVSIMPGMTHVFGEKSYNASETMIYQHTGGLFVPKGIFYYDYKKASYADIKDFLEELRGEAQGNKQLEEAAQNLSDAWKDALRAEQELMVIKDVVDGLASNSAAFLGSGSVDSASARSDANAFANGSEVQGEIIRAAESADSMQSDDGAMRKLEDFSLDSGDSDKKEASDAMREMLPVLRQTIAASKTAFEKLQSAKDKLGLAIVENKSEEDFLQLRQAVLDEVAQCSQLGTGLEQLAVDFKRTLLGYVQIGYKKESEYSALARLCESWKLTMERMLSGTMPIVNVQSGITIPNDYPLDVVPLLKNSVVAIYQKEQDGSIMLTLKTGMTPQLVMDYYRLALSSAENVSEVSMAGMLIFSAEKDDYEIGIMAGANQMGGTEPTMVQITLMPMT